MSGTCFYCRAKAYEKVGKYALARQDFRIAKKLGYDDDGAYDSEVEPLQRPDGDD